MNSKETVYKITSQIPRGKVLTYGKLAKMSGVKNPRQIGSILHKNEDSKNVPCHRVVSSLGKVADNYAFGGGYAQRKRLEQEGIIFEKEKIDLNKYLMN